jgi:hypothetical protein
MNDDVFNLQLRKFLKRFGVTAQREIEQAVQAGLAGRRLTGTEILPVRATLTIPGLLSELVIEGEIALEGEGPAAANDHRS